MLWELSSCLFFVAATNGAVSRIDSLLHLDCVGLLTGLVDPTEMVDMDVALGGVDYSVGESSMHARHL